MSYLFVLSVLVKGLLVLGIALALGLLLRRASAAVRHGVWVAAFAALLLLPVLELAGPKWTVPFELAPAVSERVVSPAPVFFQHPPAPPAPPPPPPAPPAPPPRAPSVLAYEAGLEAQAAAMERRAAELERHAEAVARHAEAEAERQLGQLHGDLERMERQLERRVERDVEVSVFGTVSHAAPHVAVVSPGSVVQTFRSIPRELVLAVLWFWGLGALAVGLAWGVAYAAAARAVRLGRPETDEDILAAWGRIRLLSGLARPVRLLRSPALDIPIAWGWGHAAVVLPSSADTWGEDRLEAVLLHELAHVQRGDAVSQLVAQIALVLHWANPLAWLAYRRFLLDREHACDDVVLEHGAQPSAYADHLVQVARDLRRRSAALAAVSPMARTSNLEGRVLSILDPARRRASLGRTAALTLAALLAAVVLPLAAFQPVAASPADCQTPAECPAPLPDEERAVAPLDDASPVAVEDVPPLGDVEVGELAEMQELAELTVLAEANVELASNTSGLDLQLALDTIPDFDEIIRPALERALEAVRAMRNSPRHRQLGLDDGDWDDMEEGIRESIDEARDDYEEAIEEAIEEAMEDLDDERWDETDRRVNRDQIRSQIRQSQLREVQAKRERAMEHARRDLQRAEDEIRRVMERETTRTESRRQASPRSRTTSSAYRTTMSNGSARMTASGPNGDTEVWMHSLDNLESGLNGIEQALDALDDNPPPGVMAGLHGGLVGIRTGMVEIRKQGRAAARTDAARRSIERRASELEEYLDALGERLADCDD